MTPVILMLPQSAITPSDGSLIVEQQNTADGAVLVAHLTDKAINERKQAAIEKNILTLRNRVSQLGISEPLVAKQGADRIVVELPGVDDPTQAIRILGATATLGFRMVDQANNAYDAMRTNLFNWVQNSTSSAILAVNLFEA